MLTEMQQLRNEINDLKKQFTVYVDSAQKNQEQELYQNDQPV